MNASSSDGIRIVRAHRLSPRSLGLIEADVGIGRVTVRGVRASPRYVGWPERFAFCGAVVELDEPVRLEAEALLKACAFTLLTGGPHKRGGAR